MKHLWSLAAAVLMSLTPASFAQSTAFTYQGQLKDGASLAEGQHDFRFRLFDAATGGTQLGTTQCVDNILVNDGVFTTTIDFGNPFAAPTQRFIEIDVRRDTGLNCSNTTGYTTLAPRQLITPAPIATQAASAFSLAAPDGSPAQAVFVDINGNVGIGTTTPSFPLHIASTFAAMALQDTGPDSTQAGYVSYRNGTGTETAWVGFGSAGDRDFSIVNARSGGDIVLSPFGGNVGIGTASPAAKLEVRGDIRLGSAGQYFASSAEENLRTIRGTMNSSGTILAGTGWSVTRPSTGTYNISFSTGFSATPTVVASTGSAARMAVVSGPTTLAVQILVYNASGTLTNDNVYFIASGPR